MTTVFSLKGRALKLDTAADVESLLEGVDPTQLTEIILEGNTIGVDASKALAKFISKATNLQVANFADIFTGRLITEIPQALSALCDALIDKTHLVEINLNDNAFGGRSVDPMVPFLTQNRNFQILKLNNNGLGPEGGSVIAEALLESARLSKAAGQKSNLRTVICGRNRLENGSAGKWAEAFAAHGGLREVRMPQNGIRMEGIIELAKGLSKNGSIEALDFQDNAFSVDGSLDGITEWTNALKNWPELHTLNLSDCIISTEGEVPTLLKALAEGSNPKLKLLQLQNDNLEGESIALLADAIGSALKNVERLEIQWNDFDEDDENLESLGDSLKQRGGRLIATDEDEEEEEEEEGEEETAEEQELKTAPPVVAEAIKEEEKEPTQAADDKDTDDLIAKLSAVKIA